MTASFNIVIGTSGRAAATSELSVSPPAIKIDLPGGEIAGSCEVTGSHPMLQPGVDQDRIRGASRAATVAADGLLAWKFGTRRP